MLLPELSTVRLQLPDPVLSVPVQLPPVELLTVTVPVGTGVPLLGAFAPTLKFTAIVCPAATEVAVVLTVVVVAAWVTGRFAARRIQLKPVSVGSASIFLGLTAAAPGFELPLEPPAAP